MKLEVIFLLVLEIFFTFVDFIKVLCLKMTVDCLLFRACIPQHSTTTSIEMFTYEGTYAGENTCKGTLHTQVKTDIYINMHVKSHTIFTIKYWHLSLPHTLFLNALKLNRKSCINQSMLAVCQFLKLHVKRYQNALIIPFCNKICM